MVKEIYTSNEINDILDFYKSSNIKSLTEKADKVCRQIYEDKIFLRGLIEFSNYCAMDCLYCGIRRSNVKVKRYRLTAKEILDTVKFGYEKGLRTFVLQSGEDRYFTIDFLCRLIENIKNLTEEKAAVTLSCGILTKKDYMMLKGAGADRYLIRFETSDEKLHKYLRNGISFKKRIKALEDLKECGYEVGSGYMTGLPGETEEIRINNALLCRKLQLDMVGIGPFIPHPDTPLYDSTQYNLDFTIRTVALVRLLLPLANIPATTAVGSLDELGREKTLQAGANVLMPNITPFKYKKHYLLYPNKICINENGDQCFDCLDLRMKKINKIISLERGDAKSKIAAV